MAQILLVEDDPVLARGIILNLELEDHEVTWAQELRLAFKYNQERPFDLVVLDLGLPDGSGLTFCKKLREEGSSIPIMILTAQVDEDSVVDGLGTGANDYVKKPFGNREFLARVKTLLREPSVREEKVRYGDILISRDQRKAFYLDHEIELNRREFDLLCFMIDRAEKVVTREALIDALDRDAEIVDRTIDSHVSHLRARLRQAGVLSVEIASVYGVGYRLEKK